ncbi:hypothetical protein LINPERHAP1_LOCUS31427, partial [Linum perenne]
AIYCGSSNGAAYSSTWVPELPLFANKVQPITTAPLKEDVALHIICDVCEKLAPQLHHQHLHNKQAPNKVIILGYSDTDAAECMSSSKRQLDELLKCLCRDLSGACNEKKPPPPLLSKKQKRVLFVNNGNVFSFLNRVIHKSKCTSLCFQL